MPPELEHENFTSLEKMKGEIKIALENILSSDLFSRSTVLSNFLKFIVEETLENRSEGLKEYTIAVQGLGKSTNFDPQTDAIIRIHAGRLRRLLNEYYTNKGQAEAIKIEVVKGTYIPVFRANTYKKTVEHKKIVKKVTNYSRTKLTLVVLPFRNLCESYNNQFFVDGLGEELTHNLSLFQNIDVVAHHTARKYATHTHDIRDIGAEIGVHYIITGSVKRTKEEIRVNVALIETLNGFQIWTQSYNYILNIDNLVTIQDQIIKKVCNTLGGYYGVIIRTGTQTFRNAASNLSDFDSALWHYYFHMDFSLETYLNTRKALEEAVAQNPNYTLRLAMLAELYLDAYSLGYPTVDNPIEEAYRLSKKALKIDPECQLAHQEFSWVYIFMKRKSDAIYHMEKALSINPNSVSTIGTIGFGMACVGEYKRANELLTQSLNLNPHCPWWFYLGFFLICYHKEQFKKALGYANQIETKDVFFEPLLKAVAKKQLGMDLEAKQDAAFLVTNFPEIKANLSTHVNAFILDDLLVNDMLKVFNAITLK